MSGRAPTHAGLLDGLTEETRAQLFAAGTPVTVEPGEILLAEGQAADALYVVIDGALEVTKRLDRGEVLLKTCEAGDLLGELAVFRQRPRSATVRVSRTSHLLRLSVETFQQVLTEPGVAMALLGIVIGRLEELQEHMRVHDRMATLGTLAVGLLHELNNPASAGRRSIQGIAQVTTGMRDACAEVRDPRIVAEIDAILDRARPPSDAVAGLDAADEFSDMLRTFGIDDDGFSEAMASLGVPAAALSALLGTLRPGDRIAGVRWLVLRGQLGQLLGDAASAAARVSEIVDAVKSFTHVDESPVQDVDVHDGLEAALRVLAGRIPPGVAVVRRYDASSSVVEGSPGDLNTVWTNLLDNAFDAVGGHGTVTVSTGMHAREIVVSIENTGPAIPDEVLERVFDPFFTTKAVGAGTGLGLSTSYMIVVQRHHGSLTLESVQDRTMATVTLPIARSTSSAITGARSSPVAPSLSEAGAAPGRAGGSGTGREVGERS